MCAACACGGGLDKKNSRLRLMLSEVSPPPAESSSCLSNPRVTPRRSANPPRRPLAAPWALGARARPQAQRPPRGNRTDADASRLTLAPGLLFIVQLMSTEHAHYGDLTSVGITAPAQLKNGNGYMLTGALAERFVETRAVLKSLQAPSFPTRSRGNNQGALVDYVSTFQSHSRCFRPVASRFEFHPRQCAESLQGGAGREAPVAQW